MLALRDHSEAELRRKLQQKGYAGEPIDASVARLYELGYLDDARFARGFAYSAVRNGRGYGARLKMELARRGVAPAIVEEVLAVIGEEFGEAQMIADTLARRFSGFNPENATEKERRRVVGYLQRKGFSLSAIFRQLRQTSFD